MPIEAVGVAMRDWPGAPLVALPDMKRNAPLATFSPKALDLRAGS
ncbi:MAG: hypothetical protein WDN24_08940 [Sphingomonas sp.]